MTLDVYRGRKTTKQTNKQSHLSELRETYQSNEVSYHDKMLFYAPWGLAAPVQGWYRVKNKSAWENRRVK